VTELPSGTVTFLFTDLEGSTELVRQLGDEYGGVLAMHQRLVRETVERHGGVEVDTQGDSFFFAFRRASEGVRAAIETQQALSRQEWAHGVTVRVRMGLHTGTARLENGRYHGLSVHRAARISAAAHGGQVLISDSTRALLADEEQLGGVSFRDLGLLELKDFERPIRVYRLAVPGLAEVDQRPRARAKRRRWAVATMIALAVGAAVAVTLVASLGGGHAAVHVPVNSVAVIDPGTGRVRSAVALGLAPSSITFDSTAAWVASRGSDTITRIDDRTHAASTIGGIGTGLYEVVAGAGVVWATEMTAGLARVNVATQTASPPVPLLSSAGVAYSAEGIAYGLGSLWVGGGLPGGLVLLRVDPATERVVKSAFVGIRSRHSIAVGQGGVWVSNLLANTVVELDPKTLHVLRTISIGAPTAIAVGGGSLWVAGADDKAVWRFDQTDGYSRRTEIRVGGDPVAVTFGDGTAWAATADGTVTRIDSSTDAVRRTRIASELNAIGVGAGAVWALVGPVSFL
jgi:class 3 adenylate cyclase/streptogramin lyase